MALHSRCRHAVLFYRDEAGLRTSVGPHIASALRTGEHVLVIAKPAMRQAFALQLHRQHVQGTPFGERRGDFITMDAAETLDRFCVDGKPDAGLFQDVVGSVLRKLSAEGAQVTAYGEMVGVLCERGQFADAVRLEHMWNELLAEAGGSLFCGYAEALFDQPGARHFRDSISAAHTDTVAAAMR